MTATSCLSPRARSRRATRVPVLSLPLSVSLTPKPTTPASPPCKRPRRPRNLSKSQAPGQAPRARAAGTHGRTVLLGLCVGLAGRTVRRPGIVSPLGNGARCALAHRGAAGSESRCETPRQGGGRRVYDEAQRDTELETTRLEGDVICVLTGAARMISGEGGVVQRPPNLPTPQTGFSPPPDIPPPKPPTLRARGASFCFSTRKSWC